MAAFFYFGSSRSNDFGDLFLCPITPFWGIIALLVLGDSKQKIREDIIESFHKNPPPYLRKSSQIPSNLSDIYGLIGCNGNAKI